MIPYFLRTSDLCAAWRPWSFHGLHPQRYRRIVGGYLLDRMDYRLVLAAVAADDGIGLLYLQLVAVKTVWGHSAISR